METLKTSSKLGRTIAKEDKVFYVVVYTVLGIIGVLALYPLIYVLSSSFSSPGAVTAGRVVLWPVDFSLEGYKAVFVNKQVGTGYINSFLYTVFGTLLNIAMTLIAAYPLSRPDLPYKSPIMAMFTFTMIFSGGMIPSYILIQKLGIMNTRLAMIIPGALSVYNMIITRTFMQNSIPIEILESAKIDGCSDIRYFFSMILPLSKAVIAVIALYYAVGHWNAYFNAFLYLNDRNLYPLQIVLRDILVVNKIDPSTLVDEDTLLAKQGLADLLKYSLIVVSCAPIIAFYPFIQKYFVKGVMIGSIKG